MSCRQEVEVALDRDAALSVECKQDIQNALSGFTHARAPRPLRARARRPPGPIARALPLPKKERGTARAHVARASQELDPGEVPPLPQETGILKHQQTIGAVMFGVGVVVILARIIHRRRNDDSSKKKKKHKPPKSADGKPANPKPAKSGEKKKTK